MKKILSSLVLAAFTVLSLTAQDLPKPSPFAKVEQVVGLTTISIEYSRPSVKERTIFGDLVAYDKVWRLGANKATKISFDTPVNIGGEVVEPGDYSVFALVNKDSWTVILNTETELWGSGNLDDSKHVVEFKAKTEATKFTETFEITFNNLTDNSAHMIFRWEEVMVSVPIKVEAKEQALANIDQAIKELDDAFRVYNSSARYYIDNDMDAKQAVEWAEKSVEIKETFWNVYTLSLAYAAAGDSKKAIKTAEKSLKMSEEAEYAPYVKMNQENIEKWKK